MDLAWIWFGLVVIGLQSSEGCVHSSSPPGGYKIVCYLGSWANYRDGEGKFQVEDIDPSLCTHLVYGFAKLSDDGTIAAYDPYLDLKDNWGLGAYERFTGLKQLNPSLKTLLAIGGWNEGSTKYSLMARDGATRKTFIDSVLRFLKKFDFDGLDLDWEYPANRGGVPEDKGNFVQLIKEMKEAFEPHRLSLTAAVSAGQETIDSAYDIPALGKYLDLIHLMAYDFHGGWDTKTGHNSPLFPRPEEAGPQRKLNVDFAVQHWLSGGAPAHKLVLGMPLYGRSFTLLSAEDAALDAPVTGKGPEGPFTREQGYLGYNEICNLLKSQEGWRVTRDERVQAPYAVLDRLWVGYDDVTSISRKVDYIVEMGLGGGMVWSIETDDFHGKCHGHKFPLLRTINEGLHKQTLIPDPDNSVETTRRSSSLPSSLVPTSLVPTSLVPSSFVPSSVSVTKNVATSKVTGTTELPTDSSVPRCGSVGYHRHPVDCKRFFYCQSVEGLGLGGSGLGEEGFLMYQFRCAQGTVFSEEMSICAFPADVPACMDNDV